MESLQGTAGLWRHRKKGLQNEYRHMYLLTPYLATINNLASAVVKDANKTMKITYTLTEEA